MENILEISKLNKSYTDFSLTDVSFSLPDNSITGFTGVNGSGKTTTIRSVSGLVKFDSGTIKLFGQDMNRNTKALKERVGVVLDEGGFYEEFSMSEMKGIVAPAYKNWQERVYKDYMEQFGLNPRQKISTLSKGMKMKFSLALALSHEAELLIMDEPTSGLDPLVRSQMLKILADYMKKSGRAVFFSTHITSDLEQIADRLILIDNGRVNGTPDHRKYYAWRDRKGECIMATLIKKDFMLLKKYLLFLIVILFALPVTLAAKSGEVNLVRSTLAFAFEVIYSEFLICRYLAMKEYQYPKVFFIVFICLYSTNLDMVNQNSSLCFC